MERHPTALKWAIGLAFFSALFCLTAGVYFWTQGATRFGLGVFAFGLAESIGAWALYKVRSWGRALLIVLGILDFAGNLIFNGRLWVDTTTVVMLILVFSPSVQAVFAGQDLTGDRHGLHERLRHRPN